MVNCHLINELLKTIREDDCCIKWLRFSIKTAPAGSNTNKLKSDLNLAIEERKQNERLLIKYYLIGISLEQLYKDIQR